jgi:hypothetical protein
MKDMNWRPPAIGPPNPARVRPSSKSNIPPRSGLMIIALRSATLRVCGVFASFCAFSHALAISMLNFQELGASGSSPPRSPVDSSLPASKRWA